VYEGGTQLGARSPFSRAMSYTLTKAKCVRGTWWSAVSKKGTQPTTTCPPA